jgi:hypothetical protein
VGGGGVTGVGEGTGVGVMIGGIGEEQLAELKTQLSPKNE